MPPRSRAGGGGSTASLLVLPDDVFRMIVCCGTDDHGVRRLRALRAVCTGLRMMSCAISEAVYQALHDRASQVCGCFPSWSTAMGITGVTQLDMSEWVQLYLARVPVAMRKFQDTLQYPVGIPTDILSRLQDNLASVSTAFGLPASDDVAAAALAQFDDAARARGHWYRMVSDGDGAGIGVYRLRVRALNHVRLSSVVSWFEGFGWHLDQCAALLFSHRCAQAMDAGSTWMVASGGWLGHMMDAHSRLVSVYSFVRRLIEERKEAEMLHFVRRRFGVAWTAETHAALHELLKNTLLDKGGIPSDPYLGFIYLRQYAGMLSSVRQDFSELRTRLLSETKSAAQATATVEIFERKMKACMPTLPRTRAPPST